MCPDDRSDPAEGNFAPPPLLATPRDAGAGFEYEVEDEDKEEEEEEDAELLLTLVPALLVGLAVLTETPPPWSVAAWRITESRQGRICEV